MIYRLTVQLLNGIHFILSYSNWTQFANVLETHLQRALPLHRGRRIASVNPAVW